jgi:Domain of unknown function (DUF4232)
VTLAPPKPPPQDELEALIKEARARQLRRRLIGAAWVAVVAAACLTTYALTNRGATPRESGSPGGAAPLCRGSQLSVAAIWDGAAGHLFNFFTITNKGAAACSVPAGRPTVVLTRGGSQLNVEERVLTGNPYGGRPVSSLAPGQRAVVHLAWWNWCGPQVAFAQTRTTVTLQFAGGLRVTARHLLGQPPCMDAAYPSTITASRLQTPGPGEV